MQTLIKNLEKEYNKLDIKATSLKKQYNSETNYGDNWTKKGQQLLNDRLKIGDAKAIVLNTIDKLRNL